ncbi:hypothetical protein [Halioxenophilus sp. WMMB6]|uniref:hypothetical protein n=1 Tax=Halioxenophilus sp. WMMB6 TaxID=3073815 RepID=UPI00295F5A99|nr:hypothetical protein [Halioxenophilus sp. WMMB6]
MTTRQLLIPFFLLCLPALCHAQIDSYLLINKPIAQIENKAQQAEAWATCAVLYDIMADTLAEQHPENSQKAKELRNGAALAVDMTLFSRDYPFNLSYDDFKLAFPPAREAGAKLRRRINVAIQQDMQSSLAHPEQNFVVKMQNSITICKDNLQGQEAYGQLWQAILQRREASSEQ